MPKYAWYFINKDGDEQGEKIFVHPIHRATLGKDWGNPTGLTESRYPDHNGKHTCDGEKLQSVGVRR